MWAALRSVWATGLPVLPSTRAIATTGVLCAEPMKKKKKLDIQLVKMRHERKIRKVEKQIRQLKKTPRQLKPIEEYKLPPSIMKELETRTRPLTDEDKRVMEDLDKMDRLWIAYKSHERRMEQWSLRRVVSAQTRVLHVLQNESPRLYAAAVAHDHQLLPFEDRHLVTETPANPEYVPPDGAKVDVSKIWFM